MKRLLTFFTPVLLAATLHVQAAHAWEPGTTHAGLTEQSALSSSLHKRLQQLFGESQGLYTMLTVPKKDAPGLFEIIGRLNPTHGYVPDASGRMTALSWLVLGAVVADVPATSAANHFFNPEAGTGLQNSTEPGPVGRLQLAEARAGKGPSLHAGGMSAEAWWKSPENPLGYDGFASQFRKAVIASTPGERERHLAGSLVAAGSMLHILQDMGAPSRVRDDISAHQQRLGNNQSDRGSRLERVAALAFGRLGVPAASKAPLLPSLDTHFTNAEHTGLADIISQSYFSAGTLPKSFKVTRNTGNTAFRGSLDAHLRRPAPASSSGEFGGHFDLVAARNDEGATWRSDSGACLAQYRIEKARIHWSIDDDCVLSQLEAILPKVAGYGASFLAALYPDDLAVQLRDGKLTLLIGANHYGAGSVHVYADTVDGTRREYFSAELTGTESTRMIPKPPAGSTHLAVLFDGLDKAGAPALASLASPWPLP